MTRSPACRTPVESVLHVLPPLAAFGLLIILMADTALAQPALPEPRCYIDRGDEICFPLGAASFADVVSGIEFGNPRSDYSSANIPEEALGEPDNDETSDDDPNSPQNYVTLGCGGTLTLEFRDNRLRDIPGPDLYVFEIGDAVEPTRLSISQDGSNWISLGRVSGGVAAVDIESFVPEGSEFRYVRLTDDRSHCNNRWPGADIDAVGAIGSTLSLPIPPKIEFVHPVTLKPLSRIAIGDSFRIRITYSEKPKGVVTETVSFSVPGFETRAINLSGNERSILSEPITLTKPSRR